MGYRIEYQSVRKLRGIQKRRSAVLAVTGLCFLAFLLCVEIFWPEGHALLRELLFSGNASVTAAAMEDLAGNLGSGISVRESVFLFCRQIMEGQRFAPN